MQSEARIEPARDADAGAVRALLLESALPVDGLMDHFPAGYALVRRGDAVVGVAGLECYGRSGVLRSVAVDRRERGRGLGVALTMDRLAAARERGMATVYLLTTTAADFYTRLGFVAFPRAEVPEAVARCPEFASVCPSSAACLAFTL